MTDTYTDIAVLLWDRQGDMIRVTPRRRPDMIPVDLGPDEYVQLKTDGTPLAEVRVSQAVAIGKGLI